MENIIQILLISIIQGIAEFIPVSSSAHINLLSNLFDYEKIELAINNIITNFTTKSALRKRLHKEKSDAPPNPTTWAAISCSIKFDYF